MTARTLHVTSPAKTSTGTGPVKVCPTHRAALDGGPVLFHCPTGHHAVYAADLPHETPRPLVPAAWRAAA